MSLKFLPAVSGVVVGLAVGYALAALRRPRIVARRLRNFRETLCVVTYNVLADGLYAAVGKHKHSTFGGYNNYSTPREREWEQRFPALMSELDACAADVICLQEVQHARYVDSFSPCFSDRGYSTHLSARGTGERDLCIMIATRDTALRVLDVEVISLSSEVDGLALEIPLSEALVTYIKTKGEEVLLVFCEQLQVRHLAARVDCQKKIAVAMADEEEVCGGDDTHLVGSH